MKRPGLLRCYLSRVENGHTIPSLDTLAKIASAMDVQLAQFFSDAPGDNGAKSSPQVSDDVLRFLNQIRRYSPGLNDSGLVALVRWEDGSLRIRLPALSDETDAVRSAGCKRSGAGTMLPPIRPSKESGRPHQGSGSRRAWPLKTNMPKAF